MTLLIIIQATLMDTYFNCHYKKACLPSFIINLTRLSSMEKPVRKVIFRGPGRVRRRRGPRPRPVAILFAATAATLARSATVVSGVANAVSLGSLSPLPSLSLPTTLGRDLLTELGLERRFVMANTMTRARSRYLLFVALGFTRTLTYGGSSARSRAR